MPLFILFEIIGCYFHYDTAIIAEAFRAADDFDFDFIFAFSTLFRISLIIADSQMDASPLIEAA